jgi:acyl carrier protein
MNERTALRKYLFEELLPQPAGAWPDDAADLFDLGLDSLRLMRLLVKLEELGRVALPDHEVTPERVGSVDALCAWLDERRGRRAA